MKLSDFKKVKPRTFVTEKGTEVKCIFWCVLRNGWEYYFIDAETNTDDIVFAYVLGHENEYGDVSLSEISPYLMGRCYNKNDLYEIAPPDNMTWKEDDGETNKNKKKSNPEIITGGRADNIPESKFDKGQLNKGIKVEMEHTNNTSIAKEIAKDHLMEDPEYYQKLAKIHKEANPTIRPVDKKLKVDDINIENVKDIEELKKNIFTYKMSSYYGSDCSPNSYALFLYFEEYAPDYFKSLKFEKKKILAQSSPSFLSDDQMTFPNFVFTKESRLENVFNRASHKGLIAFCIYYEVIKGKDTLFIESMAVNPQIKRMGLSEKMIELIMKKYKLSYVDFGETTLLGEKIALKYEAKGIRKKENLNFEKRQNPLPLPHSGTVIFTFSEGGGDIMAVDGKIYPFSPDVVCELSKTPKKGDKVKFSLYENLYSSIVDYLIVINERSNELKPVKNFLKNDNPSKFETPRNHLPYGFKSYTGVVWSDGQVDEYNRLTDRINKCIEEKGQCSEELLNASHKLIVMFSAKSKPKKEK